ncbi:MAG: TIR domain-containing protein [Gammaproteobacteria bacterium]|nr:TIR domain-containing protein [Gammaproteobacteria bacterium]MDD9814629.1 TIR domain-containing protein [Gammaproteobacteria bacterium]MDD9870297.1 TIR domain-containing protein [Gammaproteobacteria bacterium]
MRKVFFSFDWDDVWQANQVRNSWVAAGSYQKAGFVDAANIEKVKRASDQSIKEWIDSQLSGTSVTVVLIGQDTYKSKWVKYEIDESKHKKNGLVGIYIHQVKNRIGETSPKGEDPFAQPPFNFKPTKNPKYPCCNYYDWVDDSGHENLGKWIEKAARQAGK